MGLTVSARLGTSMPVLGPDPALSDDRPRGAGRLLFLRPAISAGGGGDLKRKSGTVDGEEPGNEAGDMTSDCARLSAETWCLKSGVSAATDAFEIAISDGNCEAEGVEK